MPRLTKIFGQLLAAASLTLLGGAGCTKPATTVSGSESRHLGIARQYGLSYLPLLVMEQQHLIEKHAQAAGLAAPTIEWTTLNGGAAATDALLSRSVDFIATGVTPLIVLWSKSGGEVKGLAALDSSPVVLNTANPGVHSLHDFSARDRIAVPAVKVSIQAVLLEMAAAREFGATEFSRLDHLTVGMRHADAAAALASGQSDINAHLASPPYTARELHNPHVRSVFNSFQLLGGPHTFDVLSTTGDFYARNPKTCAAVLAALEEAMAFIERDKQAAAELYLKATASREPLEDIVAQLNDPSLRFATTPMRVEAFGDFLYRTGAIKTKPSWKDLFFPLIQNQPGS